MSGGDLVGGEDDAPSDASHSESEDEKDSEGSEGGEDSEDDDGSLQDTSRYLPSTYLYLEQLDFPDFLQQSPLLSLSRHGTFYSGDELTDDDEESGSSCSSSNFGEDVERKEIKEEDIEGEVKEEVVEGEIVDEEVVEEEVEIDGETGIPISRFPSIYHQVPLTLDVQLSEPERREGVISYMDYMQQEVLMRKGRGRGGSW